MDRTETGILLREVQKFDNRTVTDDVTVAWHQVLAGVSLPDAMAAHLIFRQESTDYLMPAHLLAIVRRIRSERLERSVTVAPDTDDPELYRRHLAAQRRAIGDGRLVNRQLGAGRAGTQLPDTYRHARMVVTRKSAEAEEVRRRALSAACPYCAAAPGEGCVRAGTSEPLTQVPAHPSRLDAAGVDRVA